MLQLAPPVVRDGVEDRRALVAAADTVVELRPGHDRVAVAPGGDHRLVVEKAPAVGGAGAIDDTGRARPGLATVARGRHHDVGHDIRRCRQALADAEAERRQVGVARRVEGDAGIAGEAIGPVVDRIHRPRLAAVEADVCTRERGLVHLTARAEPDLVVVRAGEQVRRVRRVDRDRRLVVRSVGLAVRARPGGRAYGARRIDERGLADRPVRGRRQRIDDVEVLVCERQVDRVVVAPCSCAGEGRGAYRGGDDEQKPADPT